MYDATDDLDKLLAQPEDPREAVERAARALTTARMGIGKGLPLPAPMEGEIEWPEDLTLIAPEQIGRMLGLLAGHTAYAESELAAAEAQVMLLEYQEGLERALFQGGRGEWETSPQGRHYGVALLQWRARARLLRGLIRGYETRYAALSRELTRRGIGWGQVGKG